MVKCPSCGSENPTHVAFCGRCGESIPYSMRAAEQTGTPLTQPTSVQDSGTGSVPMKKCNWCGELNKWSANYCTHCGRDPHGQAYLADSTVVESRPPSGLPVAGGIFTILGGVAAVAMGLMYIVADAAISSIGGYDVATFGCCGLLFALFGVGAFFGGINAVQRKNFWLALLGSIVGILGIGFLIGAVFSLIGLILIAVSREEFES